jgi:hypothetical protein
VLTLISTYAAVSLFFAPLSPLTGALDSEATGAVLFSVPGAAAASDAGAATSAGLAGLFAAFDAAARESLT